MDAQLLNTDPRARLADALRIAAPDLRAPEYGHDLSTIGFSGVSFLEGAQNLDALRDRIVLCPGIDPAHDSFNELLSKLADAKVAAMVIRASSGSPNASVSTPTNTSIAILALTVEGDWAQLADSLRVLLHTDVADYVAGTRLGDLFGAADALASLLGGAVSLVDASGQVIGYSTHADQPIDELRRQTTLSLREGSPISEDLEYREILRAHSAILLAAQPGQYARVARVVRYAGELLGTVWVVQVNPQESAATIEKLNSVAPTLAQHFLRARTEASEEDRRRSELVRALLENTQDARVAASQLSLPPQLGQVVVSFGIEDQSSSNTKYGIRRLMQLVQSSATTSFAHSETALLENRVVSIIAGATAERIRAFAEFVCRQDATIACGIGSEVSSLPQLRQSLREAELAVSALLAAGDDEPTARQVSAFTEVRDVVALQQLADSISSMDVASEDAFASIAGYDRTHGSELALTLRTFFNNRESVRTTAQALHVHQNTVRYRIALVRDILGIDIDEPHTRLWLWLRLVTESL